MSQNVTTEHHKMNSTNLVTQPEPSSAPQQYPRVPHISTPQEPETGQDITAHQAFFSFESHRPCITAINMSTIKIVQI